MFTENININLQQSEIALRQNFFIYQTAIFKNPRLQQLELPEVDVDVSCGPKRPSLQKNRGEIL